MIIKYYVNKRNKNKFLEVHNDGHYHNAVRQFMHWDATGVTNRTGDGYLHRWRINDLKSLLDDYTFVKETTS